MVVKLLLLCVAAIGASFVGVMSVSPYLFGERRWQRPHSTAEVAANADLEAPLAVALKTQTRGLLDLHVSDGSKFLMVQCHRGQFSNRLMCLKAGVHLARALQRVLVLPVFTDSEPAVNVSDYVSLECFRRNNQVVTFAEFRDQLCRGVGLRAPEAGGGSGAAHGLNLRRGAAGRDDEEGGGSFCEEGALLQLENSYSLSDYRGLTCWARSQDITNARTLGVEIKRCSHVAPLNTTQSDRPYGLDQIREVFGGRPEKVLLFLDLFGVNLLPAEDDLSATVADPSQMCGWMPPERAAAAADVVMQALIPGVEAREEDGEQSRGASAAAAAQVVGAAAGGATRKRLASAGSVEVPAAQPASFADPPPPIRLRGTRPYMAVHLRRADWFYYCAGKRNCFYSMAEAGAWMNATLASRGLDTLYVSTNADQREMQMLRRAVSGRVLFWEDVLVQLQRWQGAAAAAGVAAGPSSDDAAAAAAVAAAMAAAAVSGGGAAPEWLRSLPLDDSLMVQMVEKAICMQASHFVSSQGSTFSDQIRYFRDGGLEERERDLLLNKWGPDARAVAARSVSGAASEAPPPSEQPTFLCNQQLPRFRDERRFPDVYNPNIFLQQVARFWRVIKRTVLRPLGLASGDAAPDAAPAAAERRLPTAWDVLRNPYRSLQAVLLWAENAHAMSAANRFVDMYTSGAVVGLALEGVQAARPDALAECVTAAAERAGAVALHVVMVGVPPPQQALIMQALEARASLQQITRMGGVEQERGNTFTMMWRGNGMGRRAEPALLESLPTFLERTDPYVLAKARVLLGDRRSGLFRRVAEIRHAFWFEDPRDGECGPEALAQLSRRA